MIFAFVQTRNLVFSPDGLEGAHGSCGGVGGCTAGECDDHSAEGDAHDAAATEIGTGRKTGDDTQEDFVIFPQRSV